MPLTLLIILRPHATLPPVFLVACAMLELRRRRQLGVRGAGVLAVGVAPLLLWFGALDAPASDAPSNFRSAALCASPLLVLLLNRVLRWLLPSFGLLNEKAFHERSDEATVRALDELRAHVSQRGVPPTVSAHAASRLRGGLLRGFSGVLKHEALRWLQHGRLGLHGLALDGFYIDNEGRRVDLAADGPSDDDDDEGARMPLRDEACLEDEGEENVFMATTRLEGVRRLLRSQ